MTSKLGGSLRSAMQNAKREAVAERPGNSRQLALEQVVLPPQQPRHYFGEEAARRLTASVKAHGILQPLLVRPLGNDRYELVAGERRYRAAQANHLKTVPVAIAVLSDVQAREAALTENLQREDVNPLEETEAVLELLSLKLDQPTTRVVSMLYARHNEVKGKTTHNVMGKPDGAPTHNVMGKSYTVVDEVFATLTRVTWLSFVTNRLPLLKLPADILTSLRRGELEYTKAVLVARIKDDEIRGRLLARIIDEKLSVTQVRSEVLSTQVRSGPSSRSPLEVRARQLPKLLKKAGILENAAIRERVEGLISELESLLSPPQGRT